MRALAQVLLVVVVRLLQDSMCFIVICLSVYICIWSFIMMVIIVDDYNDGVMVIMMYIRVYSVLLFICSVFSLGCGCVCA